MIRQMFYIRTDMNDTIATGHVMRCLSIADALKVSGGEVSFILADEQAENLIHKRGHQTIVLHSLWNNPDAELETLKKVIDEYGIRSLLIDSYLVTENYLRTLSEIVKTAYIDDLNAFIYPVHVLICYAVYWKKFCYKEKYSDTQLLSGPQYTPLRGAFGRREQRTVRKYAEKLLILSGGTDRFNVLEQLLNKIELKKFKEVNVICGNYYEGYENFCEKYRHCLNVHFNKSVAEIETYMMEADIAISAGGTTLYELCACGTPTISYSFADNQLDNVLFFHQEGIIDYAGDVRSTDIFENVKRILSRYCNDLYLRRNRSQRMQELVDGKGAKRIAEVLFEMNKITGNSQMRIGRKSGNL